MGGVEKEGKARNVRGVTFIVLLTWNVCLSEWKYCIITAVISVNCSQTSEEGVKEIRDTYL